MNTDLIQSDIKNSSIRWTQVLRETAWQLLPPITYFVLMRRYFPQWDAFWIYSDEGFNVMKGMLVARGYNLYSQIWSDQPPLFTHLLASLYRVNGLSIYASRLVVLLFSCLLLWAVIQYLRLAWGNAHALAGAVIIVLLPYFATLSVAALVGQPSLALAMVALLALGAWHWRRARFMLVLSAIALGASLLTKLFTAFLAPIFVAGLVLSEFYSAPKEKSWSKILFPAVLWTLTFTLFTLAAGLMLTGPNNIMQLIQPHLSAAMAEYDPGTQNYPITFYLRDGWAILLLALIGAGYVVRERRWLMLYPLAWMATATVILLNVRPVWFHHQMLITLPAAMLAGGATVETFRLVPRAVRSPSALGRSWLWLTVGVLAIGLVLATRPVQALSQFQDPRAPGEQRAPFEDKVMRKISLYANQTNWMVTDLPMFAFRSGIPVPPSLAVISGKRLASGELTEADILETVKTLQPEQVLIGRFDFPVLEEYLDENYRSILEREDELKLFVRKDLVR